MLLGQFLDGCFNKGVNFPLTSCKKNWVEFPFGFIFLSLALTACSLKHRPVQNMSLRFEGASSAPATDLWRNMSPQYISAGGDISGPSSFGGFSCLGVNVVGSGIKPDSQVRDLKTSLDDHFEWSHGLRLRRGDFTRDRDER